MAMKIMQTLAQLGEHNEKTGSHPLKKNRQVMSCSHSNTKYRLTVWIKTVKSNRKSSPFDNIPGPPCNTFLYGNLNEIFNKNGWEIVWEYLYTFDPLALSHIFSKDQDTFEQPKAYISLIKYLVRNGILATTGEGGA
ncbi:cytochrome P450 [Pyrrhoderma noxium]|uniref:Cytochrome P450 n=1 Tax=Pyrrhoderma noxium TaxID=2282107 RepID=A0A286UQ97_9AGAM|nr:cytochrome P450 [Pyrrhoderma noxium]